MLLTTQPTRRGAVTPVWKSSVHIVSTHHAPRNGGPIYRFFGESRPYGPAGWLALQLLKAGYVETKPGPTTTHKKVWICDICHRQIHIRKQISIRCNRIVHWVHLRGAGIHRAQYADTWTYHLHIKSRLPTHTDITPPNPPRPWTKPPTHSTPNTTHTTTTQTQKQVSHSPCSYRIVKSQIQSSHPLTPHLLPHSESNTHISHTPPTTLTPRITLISSTSSAVDMRPTLDYTSSIWSTLASSTSINKLQVMQNAALRPATGCTQDTNIQHLHEETLTLPIHEHLQPHASQYKQKHNTIISLTQTYNILQHSKAKPRLLYTKAPKLTHTHIAYPAEYQGGMT